MCDEPKVGFIRSQIYLAQGEAMLRKDKRKAQQEAAPAPVQAKGDNLTAKAATAVAAALGVVVLADFRAIAHAFLITAIVIVAVGGISGAVFVWWRVRRGSVTLTGRAEAAALAEAERRVLEQSRHPAIAARRVIPGVVISERRERLPRGR